MPLQWSALLISFLACTCNLLFAQRRHCLPQRRHLISPVAAVWCTLHFAPRIAIAIAIAPTRRLLRKHLVPSSSPTPSLRIRFRRRPRRRRRRCSAGARPLFNALISPPVSPPSPHTPARRSPRSPAALCCCFQARCSPPALDVRVCGAVSARAKPPPARHEGTPTSPRRSPTAYGRCRRVRAHALTQVRSSAGR